MTIDFYQTKHKKIENKKYKQLNNEKDQSDLSNQGLNLMNFQGR